MPVAATTLSLAPLDTAKTGRESRTRRGGHGAGSQYMQPGPDPGPVEIRAVISSVSRSITATLWSPRNAGYARKPSGCTSTALGAERIGSLHGASRHSARSGWCRFRGQGHLSISATITGEARRAVPHRILSEYTITTIVSIVDNSPVSDRFSRSGPPVAGRPSTEYVRINRYRAYPEEERCSGNLSSS